MTHDEPFLGAIREHFGDEAPRLIYADWLEEHGQPERAELIRVCVSMRRTPVFGDEYWRFKARRNELRAACTADWLAATGCDGLWYDPIYRNGIPPDWKGRWRLIREFTERWHGIAMNDIGGRRDEIQAEERRLGHKLPPSLREYIAYAHDVAPPGHLGVIHRDLYTMRPIDGQPALSIMMICEGNVQWAIRNNDLRRRDPPVYAYYWPPDDYTRYVRSEDEGPEARTLTDFVLGFVNDYKPDGGVFSTQVRDADRLREQLDEALPIRITGPRGATYEGGGFFVHLNSDFHRPGFVLTACVQQSCPWERLPEFLWEYARHAHTRGGMFLSEEDRQRTRAHWGGEPPPPGLVPPAPPPMRVPPAGEHPGLTNRRRYSLLTNCLSAPLG